MIDKPLGKVKSINHSSYMYLKFKIVKEALPKKKKKNSWLRDAKIIPHWTIFYQIQMLANSMRLNSNKKLLTLMYLNYVKTLSNELNGGFFWLNEPNGDFEEHNFCSSKMI